MTAPFVGGANVLEIVKQPRSSAGVIEPKKRRTNENRTIPRETGEAAGEVQAECSVEDRADG
jgi:hypothetical protein